MAPNPHTHNDPDRDDLIAVRAYELFEARGSAPGNDYDDWFKAERKLIDEGVIRGEMAGISNPQHQAAPA